LGKEKWSFKTDDLLKRFISLKILCLYTKNNLLKLFLEINSTLPLKPGHTYLSIINPNVFPAIFGYLYTVETELIN
jgi:hypothetical protein